MAGYLRPTAPIHADALLPGDPGRAMALATGLLEKPLMANHARGLWGYSGRTPDGVELTIQSTGIGGPSAAAVLRELSELGVRRAVRIGTCRAFDEQTAPGGLIVASEAIAADGVSRELGANGTVFPDPELAEAVRAAAAKEGASSAAVVSADLERHRPGSAALLDLATAPLFALGAQLGVAVASLLVVREISVGEIDDELLAEASLKLGRAAVAAFSTSA